MSNTHTHVLNKFVPAAFFGMILGLVGLGGSWRFAATLWSLPFAIVDAIMLTATAVWCALILLFAAKWIWARAEGRGGIPSPHTMLFHRIGSRLDRAHRNRDATLCTAHRGTARDHRHRGTVDLWCVPHGPTMAGRSRSEHYDTVMIRLLPWIVRQPFTPSYWAFTFGLSAVATSFLRFAERGAPGPISAAAPRVFFAVNLVIGGMAVGTLWLLLRGRLLPPPLVPPPAPLPAAPRVL